MSIDTMFDNNHDLLMELNQEFPDVDRILEFVQKGANINVQSERDGYTALMIAVDQDNQLVVETLLQLNANPLIKNYYDEKASDIALTGSPIYLVLKNYELIEAIILNNLSMVKNAFASGADINFGMSNGYTPLLMAIKTDALAIVELFISLNLSHETNEVHHVENMMISDAMKVLIEKSSLRNIISNSSRSNQMTDKNTPDITQKFFTEVCKDNPDLDLINQYLDEGADVNYQEETEGNTALIIAAQKNNLPLVELLLTRGALEEIYRHDVQSALSFAEDKILFETIAVGKPLSEAKKYYFRNQAVIDSLSDKDKNKITTFKDGTLHYNLDLLESIKSEKKSKPKNVPFSLEALQFRNCDDPATQSDIEQLEKHYGHPLPEILIDIYQKFNGGEPSIDCFDEDGELSIHYFYSLNDKKNEVSNIWNNIESFSNFLNSDSLSIAQDAYGSVIYLQWNTDHSEVWLLQYGDQIFDDESECDEQGTPFSHFKLADTLNEFLESLYES